MVAGAFPIGEGVWIAAWCVLAGILALLVYGRVGLLRSEVLDGAGLVQRFALRRGLAVLMLPVVLAGWFLYEPVRDAWDGRFGICIRLFDPADAERFLREAVVPHVFESSRSCAVRYDVRDRGEFEVLRVEVDAFGISRGAFEAHAERRAEPIRPRGTLGWPRRSQLTRERGRTVLVLELARDAALIVSVRSDLSDVQLERLVRTLREREALLDPLVRR